MNLIFGMAKPQDFLNSQISVTLSAGLPFQLFLGCVFDSPGGQVATLFKVTAQLFDHKRFAAQLFNVTEQYLNELLRKYCITFYNINNDIFFNSPLLLWVMISTHDFNELKLFNYMGHRYIPYLFNL